MRSSEWPTCLFCGSPTNPKQAYRKVQGWVSHGDVEQQVLMDAVPAMYACVPCVLKHREYPEELFLDFP